MSASSNALRVTGDVDDALLSPDTWVFQGEFSDAVGPFARYTLGNAVLEVDTDLDRDAFAFNVDLGAMNGVNGGRLSGAAADDGTGTAVSNAGDVNGDGFADLLVGAPLEGGTDAGAAYVVFGKAGGFTADSDLGLLDGTDGFRLSAGAAGDAAGISVSNAGDVNGDGFADVVVGANAVDANGVDSGAAYVVFGHGGAFAPDTDLSALNGTTGFRLSGGATLDFAGVSVSSLGDLNGDGFDDVLVGANGADAVGNPDAGAAYVVFGHGGAFAADLNLSTLDGTNGFSISGEDGGDFAGISVATAGDVNGDGFDDLIVGADRADPGAINNAGSAYVVFGSGTGFAANLDLAGLDGSTGFKLPGLAINDATGNAVSGAGDLNGDGFADIVVGGARVDPNGLNDAGTAYVVFGKATGFAATVDFAALNGSDGFVVTGGAANDFAGFSVSSAGDVNGDGTDDLLLGANRASPGGLNSAGEAYLIYGKTDGFVASLDLSTLNPADGFRITGGAAGDLAGAAVSGAGDVNGDGFDDLMVGANGATTPGGAASGAAYFVFGADFTGTAVDFLGGAGADVLTGTAAAESFVAGVGNDVVTLGGNGDAAYGGAGNDVFIVGDTAFRRVDGGSGTDTLQFAGAALDLTAIADSRLGALEFIDLRGSGNNSLTLDGLEVLNLSDTTNTLHVRGNAGDAITTAAEGWVAGALVTEATVEYQSYTLGQATLLVETAMTQNVL
jgi:hypothetical protein